MAPLNETTLELPGGGTAGKDHAALALLPFAAGDGEPGPRTVTYQITVDERIRRISVTLVAGESGCLPTATDQLVFLGLLQLAAHSADPGGWLEFRRTDLFDLLGWSHRNDTWDFLRSSLRRLHELTIRTHTELLSRSGRPYGSGEEGAHLIDRYRLGSARSAVCRVLWGDLVREGFALGDLKRLDWSLCLRLGSPTAIQLYRLLDRVTLSGAASWDVGWRNLAHALGFSDRYDRPAKFRDKLQPHLERLAEQGVLESYDYARGGDFTFHLRHPLRKALRQVLVDEFGLYEATARQLLAAHDEAAVMTQCDCLVHGDRRHVKDRPAYLAAAIRDGYPLAYPPHDPLHFQALWGTLRHSQQQAYHQAALGLLGRAYSLLDAPEDPTTWQVETRAVARFLANHAPAAG